MPKFICVIPCRAGSKRIKNKNQLTFLSQSLIQRAYDLANKSEVIDKIIISTNSQYYLDSINKTSKYIDIGLRSEKNSLDFSTDKDFLDEIIIKLEKQNIIFEYIIHIRPTYPSLTKDKIDEAANYFLNFPKATSLKSVEKLSLLKEKCLQEDKNDSKRLIDLDGKNDNRLTSLPSQKCTNLFAQTAAIDIYKVEIIKNGSLWGDYCLKFELGYYNADIDYSFDIPLAYSALDYLEVERKIINNKTIEISFDIDGVIFSRNLIQNYSEVEPNYWVIDFINFLSEKGCKIIIFTARGTKTGKDWKKITISQLEKYSVSYDELVFGKPGSDFYVDDKNISLERLKTLFKYND